MSIAAVALLLVTLQPLPSSPQPQDEVAVMQTNVGSFVLMFYPEVAPKHVENFKSLAREGFYDGTRFHRCIPGFVIQGGDPNSKDLAKSELWGEGGKIGPDGKERDVPAEFGTRLSHERGVLSMARAEDPNSASSQFFVCVANVKRLDKKYSAFGRVVKGMDVVDKIVRSGPTAKKENGKVPIFRALVLEHVKITTWADAQK